MEDRNFNTISPSAKSLLFMKAYTNIPFALETADLAAFPEKFSPDYENKDINFWIRLVHFEKRYQSINELLEGLKIKNFLELASGYSFRSLDKTLNEECFYIDTDLDDMIHRKKIMAGELMKNKKIIGNLDFSSLNALDEKQFNDIVDKFPAGEIVILNEGLLMYLNEKEKSILSNIIHKILEKRGGYWITADIYFKTESNKSFMHFEDHTRKFFEEHKIQDNKFESPESAAEFFDKNGFVIDKESESDYSKLSSIKYYLKLLKSDPEYKRDKKEKYQTTWRLKIKQH
jgi:hypothetical protein